MSEVVRVLIVDDSAFVRRAVERMLQGDPRIEVVGFATDGRDAIDSVKSLKPDVVILDVNMPGLDGLQALETIMTESPTAVLMLSTMTREGARTTLLALELGAVDFLDKTSAGSVMDIYALAPVLREKVLAVAGASVPPHPVEAEATPALQSWRGAPGASPYEVVVVGASTGGPRALAELLGRLPGDFPAGIVIAQHMPPGFTSTLAERLDRRSGLEVTEARDQDEVRRGAALLAPGGKQISLARSGGRLVTRVDDGPSNLLHRPCVDLLLSSAAEVAGSRVVGVILTGMGDDGARGLRAVRDAGGRTLAESADTAVIYGMPRAAAAAAEEILPLREIAPALVRITSTSDSEPSN